MATPGTTLLNNAGRVAICDDGRVVLFDAFGQSRCCGCFKCRCTSDGSTVGPAYPCAIEINIEWLANLPSVIHSAWYGVPFPPDMFGNSTDSKEEPCEREWLRYKRTRSFSVKPTTVRAYRVFEGAASPVDELELGVGPDTICEAVYEASWVTRETITTELETQVIENICACGPANSALPAVYDLTGAACNPEDTVGGVWPGPIFTVPDPGAYPITEETDYLYVARVKYATTGTRTIEIWRQFYLPESPEPPIRDSGFLLYQREDTDGVCGHSGLLASDLGASWSTGINCTEVNCNPCSAGAGCRVVSGTFNGFTQDWELGSLSGNVFHQEISSNGPAEVSPYCCGGTGVSIPVKDDRYFDYPPIDGIWDEEQHYTSTVHIVYGYISHLNTFGWTFSGAVTQFFPGPCESRSFPVVTGTIVPGATWSFNGGSVTIDTSSTPCDDPAVALVGDFLPYFGPDYAESVSVTWIASRPLCLTVTTEGVDTSIPVTVVDWRLPAATGRFFCAWPRLLFYDFRRQEDGVSTEVGTYVVVPGLAPPPLITDAEVSPGPCSTPP